MGNWKISANEIHLKNSYKNLRPKFPTDQWVNSPKLTSRKLTRFTNFLSFHMSIKLHQIKSVLHYYDPTFENTKAIFNPTNVTLLIRSFHFCHTILLAATCREKDSADRKLPPEKHSTIKHSTFSACHQSKSPPETCFNINILWRNITQSSAASTVSLVPWMMQATIDPSMDFFPTT